MKSRIFQTFTLIICAILLLSACEEKADVNEAVWDLYSDMPFTELISTVLESQEAFLETGENEVQTSYTLSEGWIQTERYTFDGEISKKGNQPYTLTMNISSKSTEGEKEITHDITSYIFLEHDLDANTLSVCASFVQSVKTNGSFETVELSTLPKQPAENELIGMLENNSIQNPPEKRTVPEGIEVETITRRYNHKPIDAKEVYLTEFPDITLFDILSRFDDAYGNIFKNLDADVEAQQEYVSLSFDVTCEYDWEKSESLNEFFDGSDNFQPYTYSATYKADGKDGKPLIATLDVFAEIEPKHGILKLRESVFIIKYDDEVVFHDVHDEKETLTLLGTIMQYYPEDAIVTPAAEEAEEIQQETQDENV